MVKKSYLLHTKLLLLVLFFLSIYSRTFGQEQFNTSVYIDSTTNQPLAEIKRQAFSVLTKDFVYHNWTPSTYWVKITPLTPFKKNERIVFSNSYNHYETIYFVNKDNSQESYTFGANQKNKSATYLPSFELNSEIKDVYISIKSETFLYESFKIEKSDKVIREISYYLIFQILIFTYIISLLIYMIVLYLKLKSIAVKKYCYYLASVILMFFFISNLGKFMIWEKLPFSMSYLEATFSFLMVSTYLIFAQEIMKTKVHLNWLHKTGRVFLVLSLIINLFILIFYPPKYLSFFANIIPPIAILLVISMALGSFKSIKKYAKLYLIGILFFVLGMSSRLLINWGILQYSYTVDAFIYLGLVIELIIFTIIVLRKIELEIKLTTLNKQLLDEGNFKIVELEKKLNEISSEKDKTISLKEIVFSENHNTKLTNPLTKREKEVLNELIVGGSQEEIANELCISKSTLKTHTGNIYSKLNVKNRVEAIHKAIQLTNT